MGDTNLYEATLLKVVDGDTCDVDINLGFGITLTNERVRIMGIDTPESRTSNKVEKVFGTAAKNRLKEILEGECILITHEDKKGEDMKGKFGRVLGDFQVGDKTVTQIMIEEGHAVGYWGGSKEELEQQHLDNRAKLLAEGIVSQADVDAAEAKMK